jgi:hypothetical protein
MIAGSERSRGTLARWFRNGPHEGRLICADLALTGTWTMEPLTPLARHAAEQPPEWKWIALFTPPSDHQIEWRTWLAQAQQAEQAATLRYWSVRVDRAA